MLEEIELFHLNLGLSELNGYDKKIESLALLLFEYSKHFA
jgi:hypothetical protein